MLQYPFIFQAVSPIVTGSGQISVPQLLSHELFLLGKFPFSVPCLTRVNVPSEPRPILGLDFGSRS